MAVTRFGVSLEEHLLEALDSFVKANGFANRSQAIRYLVEKFTVEEKWKCGNIVAGAMVLVYAIRKTEVQKMVTQILTAQREHVLSIQGFFLSENNYMEVIALKGEARKLTAISEELLRIKGIQHGKLVMSKVE